MLTMQGGDSLVGGLPIIHITYQQYIANPSAYQDPDVIVHISGFPTAGNMPADYVGYDSNLNMEDIGNIATKAIAKVEPSDTALYLHEVGTGFINKDGNYCITDVQISVGGTITLGTNCHVVDGGISGNLGNKTIATATANQTFAQQLTYLSSYYNTLSEDDKLNSALVYGNGLVMRNVKSDVGRFSVVSVVSTGVSCATSQLSDNTYYTSLNNTVTNSSSSTNTTTIALMILK